METPRIDVYVPEHTLKICEQIKNLIPSAEIIPHSTLDWIPPVFGYKILIIGNYNLQSIPNENLLPDYLPYYNKIIYLLLSDTSESPEILQKSNTYIVPIGNFSKLKELL